MRPLALLFNVFLIHHTSVAKALSEKLARRERRLIRACEIANHNPDVASIEHDLGMQQDDILETWADAPAR
jgi:hypothetical protein